MKRILSGILAAAVILTGCGASDSSSSSVTETSSITVSESLDTIINAETGECNFTTLTDIQNYYKERNYEMIDVSESALSKNDTRSFYTFKKDFKQDPAPDNDGDCYRVLADINGTMCSVVFGLTSETSAEEAKSYIGSAETTYICRLASNTDRGVPMLIPVLEGTDGSAYKVVKSNLSLLKLNKNTLTEESSEVK